MCVSQGNCSYLFIYFFKEVILTGALGGKSDRQPPLTITTRNQGKRNHPLFQWREKAIENTGQPSSLLRKWDRGHVYQASFRGESLPLGSLSLLFPLLFNALPQCMLLDHLSQGKIVLLIFKGHDCVARGCSRPSVKVRAEPVSFFHNNTDSTKLTHCIRILQKKIYALIYSMKSAHTIMETDKS